MFLQISLGLGLDLPRLTLETLGNCNSTLNCFSLLVLQPTLTSVETQSLIIEVSFIETNL